ncbi:MAG TPA: hypothetical protein VJ824_05665 [Bacillota bacterium]|nr:hypothetical protein [Bacillota bacterium]
MGKLLKVIEGKYGTIRVLRAEKQATKDGFDDWKRYMTESLYRQFIRKTTCK